MVKILSHTLNHIFILKLSANSLHNSLSSSVAYIPIHKYYYKEFWTESYAWYLLQLDTGYPIKVENVLNMDQ